MDIIDYIFGFIQSIDPFWFMKLFTWARIGNLYFGTFFTILFWLSIFIAIVSIGTNDILRLILEPIYNVLVYFKINRYNICIVLQIIFIFVIKDRNKMIIQILITFILFCIRMYITKKFFKVLLYSLMYILFLFVLRSSLVHVFDDSTFYWIGSIICIIVNTITYINDKENYDI